MILAVIIAGAAIWFALTAFVAWILMLLLGVFASLTGFTAFAIGFWPCVVLSLILGLLLPKSN